jgi:hypothetical protein
MRDLLRIVTRPAGKVKRGVAGSTRGGADIALDGGVGQRRLVGPHRDAIEPDVFFLCNLREAPFDARPNTQNFSGVEVAALDGKFERQFMRASSHDVKATWKRTPSGCG